MSRKLSYAQPNDQSLPEGWFWSTLGDVADVMAGNPAPQGDEYFANGKYPFVRVQDMGRLSGATKINATNDYVNDKALKGLHLFPKGSVLFTKSGASTLLNQRAMLGSDMYVVSHIAVAIPRGGILSEWLYYWLRTVDFAHLAHATTLPSLPLSKAKTIPIPIAPLDQQERIIAEIEKQFSRLDEAVANLKRVKANLKRYKATVLKAAVEGRLVETEAELARREGRSYETGEQLLQRILETRRSQWKGKGKYKEPAAPDTTDLPELPEGWVWATWDQISNWVTYGFTRPMPHVEDGVPIVTAKHVIDGRIVLDDTHKTPYQDYVELSAKDRPEPGDILITKDGTIGRAAVVPQHEGFCINQSVAVVWLRSCPIHRQYLLAIIESELVQKPVREKARGVAIKHLSITDFAMLPLPIAPLEEQTRIVAEVDHRLSILRAAEAAIKANLQRSGGLKQATLAAAFGPTGTRRGSLNAN